MMLDKSGTTRETLSASYYHTLSPLNTAVGAEVAHSFSTKENTITAGTQHQLDQLTTVKASVNNFGKATALLLLLSHRLLMGLEI